MKLKQKTLPRPRIEMLPLIDIVFLLLVFFIYAMLSMAVHRGMDVILPGSAEAMHTDEVPLSLTVKATPHGLEIYLNADRISLDDLEKHLRSTIDQTDMKSSPALVLFADETVSYQQLFQVLDRVNGAGIERISLQAKLEKP
jgi:biopolymer transport protein ExbD